MSRVLCSWLLVALLSGCAATSPGMPEVSAPVSAAASVAPLAGSAPALSPAAVQRVLLLLDRAEQSMLARRFTTPAERNAWQDYREVLSLLPGHAEALAGLRKIADTYIDWGYAALRQDEYPAARNYLARARLVMPEHPALAGLQAVIPAPGGKPEAVAKRAPVAESPGSAPAATAVIDAAQAELSIDRRQLRQRSRELQLQLAGYADLIQARNSRITIEAPTDADGRWLYQRLNDRQEAYRIRANFRLNPQPRIRLLD